VDAAPRLALPPVLAEPPESAQRAGALTDALGVALRDHGRFEVTAVQDADSDAPTASEVRGWALETGADAVVAARLESGQLWVELRSAHSGGLLGGWAVDPGLAPAVALPVMAEIRELLGAPDLDDSLAPPAEGEAAAVKDPLLGSLRADGPISIKSDQLDVVSSGGKRHLVFKDNVRVEQGDIVLHTSKLDAFYREGDSQPERLVAIGGVRVQQGERRARCDRATFQRSEQRIVCSGRAKLVQGCDVVRGGRIEFDLEREHFTVMGAASVVLGREGEQCGAGGNS
jgi:lipopolysaccharide export system protein LptA